MWPIGHWQQHSVIFIGLVRLCQSCSEAEQLDEHERAAEADASRRLGPFARELHGVPLRPHWLPLVVRREGLQRLRVSLGGSYSFTPQRLIPA